MSAFVVSNAHIDALVTYATGGGPWRVTGDNPTTVGQMLLDENYRSVNHRYSEADPAPKYRFRPYIKPLSAVTVIKLCQCFDYQACETSDYHETPAARMIDAIRSQAINALPGYDDAPWGLEDHRTHTVELV